MVNGKRVRDFNWCQRDWYSLFLKKSSSQKFTNSWKIKLNFCFSREFLPLSFFYTK